jgi:hypothetical protein
MQHSHISKRHLEEGFAIVAFLRVWMNSAVSESLTLEMRLQYRSSQHV